MGKIALNMIARDAGSSVIAALESTKGAIDVYVIGFAGRSSDLTREAVVGWLEENGVEYLVDEFDFVDFSDARNRVLDMTPDDVQWVMWMDTDDTILGIDELREIAEECGKGDVGAVQFPYIYHQDAFGNPLVIHDRERLVRRDLGWRWFRPVHETLNTTTHHRIVRLNNLTWVHRHELTESTRASRNLALLQEYVKKNPDDVRTLSYLAHAYFSTQKFATAIEWFQRAFDRPTNDLEKWQSAIFLGRCWLAMEEHENAIGWAWQAIDLEPRIADSYLLLGACYTELGEMDKAYEFFRISNDKQQPPSLLFVLPNEYTFNRWVREHHAAAGIGKLEEAIEICRKALKHSPGHEGFIYYLLAYEEAYRSQTSKRALQHLVEHLKVRGDAVAATELLRYIPKNIVDDDDMQELMAETQRCVEHLYNEEAFEMMYGGGADVSKSNIPAEHLLTTYTPVCEPRFQRTWELVQKHKERVEANGERLTIVDLGCGDGVFTVWLAMQGCLVTGIESSPDNVVCAQQLAERMGVGKRTRFICSQIERLEVETVGAHDLAICLEIIEHVANPALVLGTGFDLSENIIFSTPHMQVGNENRKMDGIHLAHVREFHFLDLLRLAVKCGGRLETLDTTYWLPEPGQLRLPGFGTWIGEITKEVKEKPAVVFYTGGSLEKWTPDSMDEGGIGGSETAIIQMAKLFSEAGHQTFVYGPVDGVWDGVVYRNHKRFVPHSPAMGNPCLLFVSSRVPEVFDRPVNSVLKALWLHDWDYGYDTPTGRLERFTKERAEQIDIMFVLSDAQKCHFEKTYPFLKGRLTVTANGIDPGRFQQAFDRPQHSFIWTSSPDRGLDRVLKMWPKIREMWNDAELSVYYGFDNLIKVYPRNHPKRKEMVEGLLAKMEQPGVTYKGRVNQEKLAEAYARSQFWFYPTSFTETYCIGAIEAQAAGCVPVTTSVAALEDKVPSRFRLRKEAGDEKFLQLLCDIDAGKVEGVTTEERALALTRTWDAVFAQWSQVVEDKFEERKEERAKREKASAKQAFAEKKKR